GRGHSSGFGNNCPQSVGKGTGRALRHGERAGGRSAPLLGKPPSDRAATDLVAAGREMGAPTEGTRARRFRGAGHRRGRAVDKYFFVLACLSSRGGTAAAGGNQLSRGEGTTPAGTPGRGQDVPGGGGQMAVPPTAVERTSKKLHTRSVALLPGIC